MMEFKYLKYLLVIFAWLNLGGAMYINPFVKDILEKRNNHDHR